MSFFRFQTIGALGAAMLCLSPMLIQAQEKAPTSKSSSNAPLPASIATALTVGKIDELQKQLIIELKKDASQLHLAMMLEFIRVTDSEVLQAWCDKGKQGDFLKHFLADAEWLELYLSAGLVPFKNDIGINVLYRIYREEKGKVRNKKLAVALASVWGGGETTGPAPIANGNPAKFNPVWRYNFFMQQESKGALHPGYKRMMPWEMRFIVGIPWQDWDDKSFEWTANNINVPWDRYKGSCWVATYTDPSKFGDDVQTGEFAIAFHTESSAEHTQRNGGVCGAMSHLGAYAAMAHGMPAYTCGQPGHCAYAVRLNRGQWEGGFGGPDGGMHNHIFGTQAPTSFRLMEEVFGKDEQIQKAYRASFRARALEATGDKKAALAAWQNAIKESPLHPFFRTELHRLMKETGCTPKQWAEYLTATLPLYRGHGFAAAEMSEPVFAELAKASDADKRKLLTLLHRQLSSTPSSWATSCEKMIEHQFKMLSSPKEQEAFVSAVYIQHMNQGDGTLFGQLLEWGIKTYVDTGKADDFGRIFATAAARATSATGKDAENVTKNQTGAYNKAIIAVEQARSTSAFQMLTDAALKVSPYTDAPIELNELKVLQDKVGGKVAPAKGHFRISSTSRYDSPIYHRNIMTVAGGRCHTDAEEKPHFIVELEKGATITGAVVRKSNSQPGRMKKATMYTSSDGATWMKRAETDNMPHEWAVPMPVGTQGRWVKIEFDNGDIKNFAHINHFIILTK